MSKIARVFHVARLSGYPLTLPNPEKVYTTNLIWVGSKVLNPVAKTYREYRACGDAGDIILSDLPYPNQIPYVDFVDTVKVQVFSRSMWSENDVLFIESAQTDPLR